jgi:PHD/YefM family antitoxin component YafN of YafNO toxin-antitoxin module
VSGFAVADCPGGKSMSKDVGLTTHKCAPILHRIMSNSTYTISQAQAQLPSLLKEDSFAISVHGEVKGFYLSKERLEAMIETLELLENPTFAAALKSHKAGKGKTYTVAELDKEFSA